MAISIAATGGGAALAGGVNVIPRSPRHRSEVTLGNSRVGFMQGAVQSPSLKGAAWGAVSGLTFHGIGSYFDSAAWAHRGGDLAAELTHTGYAAKVMAHAVAGGTLSHLQGGKFGSSFAAAGLSQAFAPAIDEINGGDAVARIQRATLSALIGGTASALSGGKFANGAVTAAMGRALNDEMSARSHAETAKEVQAIVTGRMRELKPTTSKTSLLATFADIASEITTYAGSRGLAVEISANLMEYDGVFHLQDLSVGACSGCNVGREAVSALNVPTDRAAWRGIVHSHPTGNSFSGLLTSYFDSAKEGYNTYDIEILTRFGIDGYVTTFGGRIDMFRTRDYLREASSSGRRVYARDFMETISY